MSKIDGRVQFEVVGDDEQLETMFIQFSVLALMDIEEQYNCSIEQLPEILQGTKVRHEDGGLVNAPVRYERDDDGEILTDSKGDKVKLPPEPPRLKEVVTLFRAGMLEYDADLTETDVAKLITRIGVTDAGRLLEEAVIAAFPEANEPAGNRQQRRASKSGNRKAATKSK